MALLDRTAPLLALLVAALAAPTAAYPVPGSSPSVFSVDLSPRGPLPDPAVVGYNETLPLVLRVTGPAGLVPPDEVRLSGSDGRGTSLSFHPNPVPLQRGRHSYPVDAGYEAPATGTAHLTAQARGPGLARATWNTTLPVGRDRVSVAVASVGEAAANWTVPLTVEANTTRLPAEAANLTPRVRSAAADPPAAWNASAVPANLSDERDTYPASFTARYGSGRYQVEVHARGPRSQGTAPPILVDVEEPDQASGTAPVTARLPDAPADLALTGDSVNEDGKRKYPGQEVITRVEARDPNGLAAADGVSFAVQRVTPAGSAVTVRNRTAPLPEDAWARREIPLEDRFGWAPLKDGRYVVEARLLGTGADPARRTFRTLDEQASLVGGALPDAVAATPFPPLPGHALVADDNLGGGPEGPPVAELGHLSARLYRHTQELPPPAAVRFPGGNRSLDLTGTTSHPANLNYSVDGDAGVFRVPLKVDLPQEPPTGRYHVTLEHRTSGSTRDLGAIYFEVDPPPAVAKLSVGPARPGSNLTVDGSLDPAGNRTRIQLVVREGPGGPVLARRNASAFPADVPVPEGLPADGALHLAARPLLPDGRTGDPGERTVPVEGVRPSLRAAVAVDGRPAPGGPLRLVPHASSNVSLTVHAAGVHDEAPAVSARLLDWNGAVRADGTCRGGENPEAGVDCRIAVPADLPTGRYTVQVLAQGPGGTARWNRSLEAGPWLEVGLPDPLELRPTGNGTLEDSVRLANRGNVPAQRVRLALSPLQGPGDATWAPPPPEVSLDERPADRRQLQDAVELVGVDGPLLPPGTDARVHVAVPVTPGVPPGTYSGSLTVTTPLEGFP